MKRRGFPPVVMVLFLVAILAAAGLIWLSHIQSPVEPPEKTSRQKKVGRAAPGETNYPDTGERSERRRRESPLPANKRIAIIIDDIGYNLTPVRELLEINAPLTFAILPQCSHSTEAAELAYRAGREILLHLPMEPHNYPDENPGPGALFLGMSDDEIRMQVGRDRESVPHASGVNNHMGSRFMEDREELARVMKILKEEGLFFIDSRTTPHSRGRELAAEAGVRFAARKVFIDNDHEEGAAMRNLIPATGKQRAESVIMIGHPYRETVQALKRMVPTMNARGFRIVPASELAGEITPGAR